MINIETKKGKRAVIVQGGQIISAVYFIPKYNKKQFVKHLL